MFEITRGKGFHMTFENGYTISVQFGFGNYCDNYYRVEFLEYPKTKCLSSDAEIAIFKKEGDFLSPEGWEENTVKGYCSPDEVLKWMNYAANLPGND